VRLRPHYMRITSATNSRTLISSLVNLVAGEANTPLTEPLDSTLSESVPVIFNSYLFDYQVRFRVGGLTADWHFLAQAVFPRPTRITRVQGFSLCGIALRFATAWLALLDSLGQDARATLLATPWRKLWAVTEHERLRLRCILDAVVAHLYGLDAEDFRWILRDCDHPVDLVTNKAFARTLDPKGFWRVDKTRDPELRHTVLSQVAFADLQKLIATHGEEDALRLFLGTGPDD